MTLRVLIADDNDIVRGGLRTLLSDVDDIEVCGEAAHGREAVDEAARLTPDVVLLDVRMPVMDGVAAARELGDTVRVLMLTYSDEDEVVTAAMRAGAAGYLVHGDFESHELAAAIRTVAEGGAVLSSRPTGSLIDALRQTITPPRRSTFGLTPRETEVMDLVAQGLTNREVADQLVVSPKTVKNHINSIFSKLDVSARAAAIATWLGVRE